MLQSSNRLTPKPISRRPFHVSSKSFKGISPHSEEPEPPQTEKTIDEENPIISEAADISSEEYQKISDAYIDELVKTLDAMAEDPESGLEVEYTQGVLTLGTKYGDYVLNKQPPNKQIWISSPISGPKRYDWVLAGGDHQHLKEGTALDAGGDMHGGQWVYLRDGSTLSDLLKKELKIEMGEEEDIGPV